MRGAEAGVTKIESKGKVKRSVGGSAQMLTKVPRVQELVKSSKKPEEQETEANRLNSRHFRTSVCLQQLPYMHAYSSYVRMFIRATYIDISPFARKCDISYNLLGKQREGRLLSGGKVYFSMLHCSTEHVS